MSKETFKEFVRTKPELARYVKNNNTTWQKLYEIYELYGENSSVWDSYLKDNNNIINEIVSTIKNVDLEKLQSGIENIQSTISLIQNFSPSSNNQTYQERYKYQKMDD